MIAFPAPYTLVSEGEDGRLQHEPFDTEAEAMTRLRELGSSRCLAYVVDDMGLVVADHAAISSQP